MAENYRSLARHVAPARVLAVVKADAYGHGAVDVARTLEPLGVAGFGVATLAEGAELREAGVTAPILVLSPTPEEGFDALFAHRLTPVVSSFETLRALSEKGAGEGTAIDVHLKFDTGMTRLGLAPEEAGVARALLLAGRGIRLRGLMSHFAEAEVPEAAANRAQLAAFDELLAVDWPTAGSPLVRHTANSAAALHLPESRFDLVRSGLALYGYDPAERGGAGLELAPVMTVAAELVQVRDVPAGRRVGYGGRFVAPSPARIGIVPLGYADGYSWRLGARAEALVRGRRVPLAGSVSMDLLALDLSATGGDPGERVTLLGAQGGERIDAVELARHVGSIPYQLLCLFGLRLPRRVVAGGEVGGRA